MSFASKSSLRRSALLFATGLSLASEIARADAPTAPAAADWAA